ncbi:MAG: hypothetical protein QW803_06845 [Candidatus Methanomethylicia archaeon]
MSSNLEPLIFYVKRSLCDRAKKVFNLDFIVRVLNRKPLLQVLRNIGRNETKRFLKEFLGQTV